MKPKNIKEAKELIDKYRSITIEEIEEESSEYSTSDNIANRLTGYGLPSTCTLCRAVDEECSKCIYGSYYGCTDDSTFDDIYDAKTSKQLLEAFKLRADYIEEVIKELEENQ